MTMPPPPNRHPLDYRCADEDRAVVSDILRDAAAEGRIDFVELDERLQVALAAPTYRDLTPIIHDIPGAVDRLPWRANLTYWDVYGGVAGATPPPPPPSAGPGVGYTLPDGWPAPTGGATVPPKAGVWESLGALVGRPDQPLVPRSPAHIVRPDLTVGAGTSAIAVLSSQQRSGVWAVPRAFTAVAMLGDVKLDLSQAVLADQVVTISVGAILGSVDIIVPEDVAVVVEGFGVLGDFDHKAGDRGQIAMIGDTRPVVRVNGLAFLGSVTVKRPKPPRGRKGRRKDRRWDQ